MLPLIERNSYIYVQHFLQPKTEKGILKIDITKVNLTRFKKLDLINLKSYFHEGFLFVKTPYEFKCKENIPHSSVILLENIEPERTFYSEQKISSFFPKRLLLKLKDPGPRP